MNRTSLNAALLQIIAIIQTSHLKNIVPISMILAENICSFTKKAISLLISHLQHHQTIALAKLSPYPNKATEWESGVERRSIGAL